MVSRTFLLNWSGRCAAGFQSPMSALDHNGKGLKRARHVCFPPKRTSGSMMPSARARRVRFSSRRVPGKPSCFPTSRRERGQTCVSGILRVVCCWAWSLRCRSRLRRNKRRFRGFRRCRNRLIRYYRISLTSVARWAALSSIFHSPPVTPRNSPERLEPMAFAIVRLQ